MVESLIRAIDPLSLFIRRELSPELAHLFGLNDRLHVPQIISDAGADDQIIEVLPLGDFLPRDAQTFLDDGGTVLAPAFKPLLKDRHGRRSKKDREKGA